MYFFTDWQKMSQFFNDRQVDLPFVLGFHRLWPTAAIERHLITFFHKRQNSFHTKIVSKLADFADGVKRKVFHRDFSICGGEVSITNDPEIVWRLVICGDEKAKLVDIDF